MTYTEACEQMASSEPEAFAVIVSHLHEMNKSRSLEWSDDALAVGRVRGALSAAALYFNPFFSPTLKDTP